MANTDFTAATPEQTKAALYEIAQLSLSLKHLCSTAMDADMESAGHLMVAAGQLASQIGWIADRHLAYDIHSGAEEWMLPPCWHSETSHEAH